MSKTFFDLDNAAVKLYEKHGESFFDSIEVKEYFDSLSDLEKSKFLLVIAYEMQEIEPGVENIFKFDTFCSELELNLKENKDIDIFTSSSFWLAKSLSRQSCVPKTLESLVEECKLSSDPKDTISNAVDFLLQSIDIIGSIEEEDFKGSIILRCIYDYETDYLYSILRNYLFPFNSYRKQIVDHPIAFADGDARSANILKNNLLKYFEKINKDNSINGLPAQSVSLQYK